jgi:hypothetical protein
MGAERLREKKGEPLFVSELSAEGGGAGPK